MLKIVTVPDPVLRKKSRKIEVISAEISALAEAMKETLEKNPRGGIGLAAPQVGANRRLLIAKDRRTEEAKIYTLVNPEVSSHSLETDDAYEGCLSIPDTYCLVERFRKVVVKGLNLKGKKVTIKAADLFARVLQHEIDHLDGVLITDKAVGKFLTEKEFNRLLDSTSTA